ncbi:bifunctional hydroxymethylpyrimidine kinase/phosphomethylpyrimidine kinase [Saccharothrix sp. S26]|uniref:bifunctional hydroxymethylpyrimidine kinase/phosphomethylpyrimidine kinase n=1 Tax=Saccharothrix sp. S26 TaxID=2907215 RepID=UPI001F2263FB|nr:bifunctional hydroxymethylpyrimidine kinase/phosphomethylpyrimidine kinase [Saccharothrix sp. S26]MCE6998245.1 bifunctional hydroxymethylpyrimidine kinase/phosphomethylpyrimidine kinase [Saccharothrix sp. S26]
MGERAVGVTPPRVMTVAGTDSGGGAGAAADLRAFAACGVHGCLAVCAVTAQNSVGVHVVHGVPPDVVAAQITAVVEDIGLDAVKTGMLGTAEVVEALVRTCDDAGIGGDGPVPLVVDPVLASMHGDALASTAAVESYRALLLPRATVTTPNLDEVRLLVGVDVRDRAGQHEAAKALHDLGARHVLVKGGHLAGDTEASVDVLYDGSTFTEFPGPRVDTENTHGGGDSFAAAITAGLARGLPVPEAVAFGKRYVVEAVRHSFALGAGYGPVSALWATRPWWEHPDG